MHSLLTLYCRLVATQLSRGILSLLPIPVSLSYPAAVCIDISLSSQLLSLQDYNYGNVLNCLELHTLSAARRHLDVFFVTDVFKYSEYRPALLDTVGLRMPNRNFGYFSLFKVDSKRRNCPSARWPSATNAIDTGTDITSIY